jgi:hypothetical protein
MDAGSITIIVSRSGVNICSSRPESIPSLFLGRTPDFVVGAIPRLYTVCKRAQTLASRLCLETARGFATETRIPSPVLAEAVREHLMRVAVDWSRALGLPAPAPEELRQIHRLPEMAVQKGEMATSEEADTLLRKWIAPAQVISAGIEKISEQSTVAGKLLARVLEAGWAGRGKTNFDPECERTVLGLLEGDASLEAAQVKWGNALVVRLYARLLHAARLVEALTGQELPAVVLRGPSGCEARVTTSRGMLIHRVQLSEGLIVDYEISAPTDVNFAPGGPASQALAACLIEGEEELELISGLLVESFDPCVTYTLRMQ